MSERLYFRELDSHSVSSDLKDQLQTATDSLTETLMPRLKLLEDESGRVRLQNFIGAMSLDNGTVAEVTPKTETTTGWASAVVQLLEPTTRIAVTGSTRSRPSTRTDDLSSALALEYARRLESALQSDGPLHVYERVHKHSRILQGRLDVTRWMRTAVLDPTNFPISRDELSPANDFNRGFSIVAGWLSKATPDPTVRARLNRLQTSVMPGLPAAAYVNPSVANRPLPSQWARFASAWSIAAPLLRNRSVVGDPGRSRGLEVAVESWPLLETTLERALQELSRRNGYAMESKRNHPVLRLDDAVATTVVPDGTLTRHGHVVATFECKYSRGSSVPRAEHVHQALATAAALGSPLSVLIYPGRQREKHYTAVGFNGRPAQLVTLGLDIFAYQRGTGDVQRAHLIERSLL